jgi:hypothetical protein
MASNVSSIVNMALAHLGEAAILSLNDDSRQARLALRDFEEIRDDLLRDHIWNWAKKRTTLAASSTDPDWEYDNAFVVPSDFLRLVDVYNLDEEDYRIECVDDVTVIVTDIEAPLKISYIAKITDPNRMDVKFRNALAAECAMRWAEPLTANPQLRKDLASLAAKSLRDAKGVDGQEDAPTVTDPDTWINARY